MKLKEFIDVIIKERDNTIEFIDYLKKEKEKLDVLKESDLLEYTKLCESETRAAERLRGYETSIEIAKLVQRGLI